MYLGDYQFDARDLIFSTLNWFLIPWANPVKNSSVKLWYAEFEHSEWLKIFQHPISIGKNLHSVKFTLKIFVGQAPDVK